MGLKGLFQKSEALIGFDIGSNSIKMVELDLSSSKPKLLNATLVPSPAEVFSGNTITRTELVANQISSLLETHGISDKRAVTAVPAPSVFTKRIKMPQIEPSKLTDNVMLEAGNLIPHNIDAVKLDYHVIGEGGKNQLDVLVVAVKNEIIDSYLACLALAGLETAVVDVDYFCLQNIFETGYPELLDKTVALINMGARYSSINICRGGQCLFSGDIAVGGKSFTDALVDGLGLNPAQAEEMKRKLPAQAGSQGSAEDIMRESVTDLIERNIESAANEFNRQLSFFWNAAGADSAIDMIFLSGGGSLVPGLLEELKERTEVECALLDPLRGIDCASLDQNSLKSMAPMLSIALGLGLRQAGDKEIPDY